MKHGIPCFIIVWFALTQPAFSDDNVPFETEVLPIFQKHCMSCHGDEKQESGLRTDSRAALLKGGDFGAAIVPGDAANSHLIEVVTSVDEDVMMPPKGERLSAAEIGALTRWIAQGAHWPGQMDAAAQTKLTSDHWAFQPLQEAFSHDSIDRLIRAQLDEKQIMPVAVTDPRSLIRRMTLDLTGLPPTPAEVKAFEAACRSGSSDAIDALAVEELADRLLASPRYGERGAQHWLDVIRYADTRGYEFNTLRDNTWPFRDWVIEALNNDLPYDQFLFQQIAGDSVGVDPATGFLVTAPLPTPPEIGQEPAAIRMARFNSLDEVIQNIGSSMLGLSVGCARCHNHKFDPISQRDYYRMVAVFSGLRYDNRPWRKAKAPESLAELKQIEKRIAAIRAEIMTLPHWRVFENGQYTDSFQPVMAKWVRLTVTVTDATSEGPAFDEVEIWTAPEPGTQTQRVSGISDGGKASSSGAATQLGCKDEFLNDGLTGKSSTWIADRRPPAWVQFELAQPWLIDRLVWSRDSELFKSDPAAHAIRLASDWHIEVAEQEGEWRKVIGESKGPGVTTEAVLRRRKLEIELTQLVARESVLKTVPTVFAGTFTEPDPIHVLMRGDPEQPRELVGPGGLDILSGVELPASTSESDRRVAFANWVTRTDNPLIARVAVNRIWQHHFGKGLVDTPSDFGIVGSRPTHPELLDWLAHEFISNGWSVKYMHKLIVTSALYRQSSQPDPRASLVDPESRNLWRFPPRRLDAESIRDSILFVTGVLDLQMGGPGVNIYGPKGSFDQWKPKLDPGPEAWRRTIYLAKMRGADDGMFKQFDLPDCGQVRAKRGESTTPLQALNLLNGSFTIEQAALLADRLPREAGSDLNHQVTLAFELILSRPPSPSEREACIATAEAEGIATICRALFNSNEFLFIP